MTSRPTRILISALATASAVSVLALAAPSANASTWTHDDGTGDVWQYYYSDDYRPVPAQVEGDITRVRIQHDPRYVRLFLTLRDNEASTDNSYYVFDVQNGRRWVREVRVSHGAGTSPDVHLSITRGSTSYQARCRGVKRARIDWTSHMVAATIPRACFGRPKYLRVNASAYLGYDKQDYPLYTDDAQSAGMGFPFGGSRAWSPWVRRG